MPSFDLNLRHNRPQLLNTSIQEFNWNELSDKDVIGSGSFGSVITAKYKGKSIVVKQLLEQHERNLRRLKSVDGPHDSYSSHEEDCSAFTS